MKFTWIIRPSMPQILRTEKPLTVGELIDILRKCPADWPVDGKLHGGFFYMERGEDYIIIDEWDHH